MSTILSIFNPTFFMFLAFVVIIVALLIFYYENKMREQNHKISSMLSLVSSLAEEINIVKIHLNHINVINGGGFNGPQINEDPIFMRDNQNNIPFSENNILGENLIEVSDDDEDDVDDDNVEDDDDDSGHDDDDDDTGDDHDNEDIFDNDIKILKLNNINFEDMTNLNDNEMEDFYDDNDNDDDNDDNDDDDDDDDEIIEIDDNAYDNDDEYIDKHLDVDIDNNEVNNELYSTSQDENIDVTKNINLSHNLEGTKSVEVIDYKKLSMNQLRSIVLDKGLVSDSSKMKKNELLKLLQVE